MDKTSCYEEILSVLDKHKPLIEGDYGMESAVTAASDRIKLCRIETAFGIHITPDKNPNYIQHSEMAHGLL